ncbi:TetR/AcrR family transcriptional regulator [Streptomyces thermoalcalitolerans]|uniref:TetR family transcriptional regulator n=1 Tax=Streptomyces thermoalcalitolerans TaxID=65605 RepID=A0ABN1NNG2_9ACTN
MARTAADEDNDAMTAARPVPADRPPTGLRERKKLRTRQAIRSAAYALIEEQGYDATTIEQIADRAEVSPSTVSRYFPAKEDIVLTDAYDTVVLEELRARPADEPWTDALRHAMRRALALSMDEEPGATRLRARLAVDVPAVRARMTEKLSDTARLVRREVAARTGLDQDGLEVRVFAASLVSGLMEAALYWAEHGHRDEPGALVDRALDVLDRGLPTAGSEERSGEGPEERSGERSGERSEEHAS